MHVKFKNLTKSFDRTIIDDVSFEDEIDTLAIIGPSGGGKSTILKILGGLLNPTSGTIEINHEKIQFDENYLSKYRKNIGFVFQHNGLFNHLTALENITLPLIKVHGYTPVEANQRAMELLTRFKLDKDGHKKPHSLSGGQQQRIAIARALAPKPQFLLLDEPTSALDPEHTANVLEMINELKESGMKFIIVTHEIGFAKKACNKVAFFSEGKLLEYGTTILDAPQSVQLQQFLGKLLTWN